MAEIRDGRPVAYPSEAINRTNPARQERRRLCPCRVSLLILPLACGFSTLFVPMFQPTQYGGPKLVCVDLTSDRVIKTILFPQDVALPTTYLNDIRFDLRRGAEGMAFITDSSDQGANGIIVVDLASGESWRKLHDHPSTKVLAAAKLSANR